jgi:hypothetical protein
MLHNLHDCAEEKSAERRAGPSSLLQLNCFQGRRAPPVLTCIVHEIRQGYAPMTVMLNSHGVRNDRIPSIANSYLPQ